MKPITPETQVITKSKASQSQSYEDVVKVVTHRYKDDLEKKMVENRKKRETQQNLNNELWKGFKESLEKRFTETGLKPYQNVIDELKNLNNEITLNWEYDKRDLPDLKKNKNTVIFYIKIRGNKVNKVKVQDGFDYKNVNKIELWTGMRGDQIHIEQEINFSLTKEEVKKVKEMSKISSGIKDLRNEHDQLYADVCNVQKLKESAEAAIAESRLLESPEGMVLLQKIESSNYLQDFKLPKLLQ